MSQRPFPSAGPSLTRLSQCNSGPPRPDGGPAAAGSRFPRARQLTSSATEYSFRERRQEAVFWTTLAVGKVALARTRMKWPVTEVSPGQRGSTPGGQRDSLRRSHASPLIQR